MSLDWPDPTYEDMSEALDLLEELWGDCEIHDDDEELFATCEKALRFLHRYGRLKSALTEDDIREHYCH